MTLLHFLRCSKACLKQWQHEITMAWKGLATMLLVMVKGWVFLLWPRWWWAVDPRGQHRWSQHPVQSLPPHLGGDEETRGPLHRRKKYGGGKKPTSCCLVRVKLVWVCNFSQGGSWDSQTASTIRLSSIYFLGLISDSYLNYISQLILCCHLRSGNPWVHARSPHQQGFIIQEFPRERRQLQLEL